MTVCSTWPAAYQPSRTPFNWRRVDIGNPKGDIPVPYQPQKSCKLQDGLSHLCLATYIWLCFVSLSGADKLSRDFKTARRQMKAIAREVKKPDQRDQAIGRLKAILEDKAVSTKIRTQAAMEIADVGAIEIKDQLKNLADSLAWEDDTRNLKWTTYKGYWKLCVTEKTDRQSKIDLLQQALTDRYDGLDATCVRIWAADELANMGVEEKLPDIIKSIQSCYRDSTYGINLIHRCKLKIELLKSHPKRCDALGKALDLPDYDMKKWAILELARLQTNEAREALIAYALDLERHYYVQDGENMRLIKSKFEANIVESGRDAYLYNYTIHALFDYGTPSDQIKKAGLHAGRCFLVTADF